MVMGLGRKNKTIADFVLLRDSGVIDTATMVDEIAKIATSQGLSRDEVRRQMAVGQGRGYDTSRQPSLAPAPGGGRTSNTPTAVPSRAPSPAPQPVNQIRMPSAPTAAGMGGGGGIGNLWQEFISGRSSQGSDTTGAALAGRIARGVTGIPQPGEDWKWQNYLQVASLPLMLIPGIGAARAAGAGAKAIGTAAKLGALGKTAGTLAKGVVGTTKGRAALATGAVGAGAGIPLALATMGKGQMEPPGGEQEVLPTQPPPAEGTPAPSTLEADIFGDATGGGMQTTQAGQPGYYETIDPQTGQTVYAPLPQSYSRTVKRTVGFDPETGQPIQVDAVEQWAPTWNPDLQRYEMQLSSIKTGEELAAERLAQQAGAIQPLAEYFKMMADPRTAIQLQAGAARATGQTSFTPTIGGQSGIDQTIAQLFGLEAGAPIPIGGEGEGLKFQATPSAGFLKGLSSSQLGTLFGLGTTMGLDEADIRKQASQLQLGGSLGAAPSIRR